MDRARPDLYYSCSRRSILPLIDWGITHRNMHVGHGSERKKYPKKSYRCGLNNLSLALDLQKSIVADGIK